MKKLAVFSLVLVCIFGLAGCSIKGTIAFYSEATLERTVPVSVTAVELSRAQTKEIQEIIDNVNDWNDDDLVNRMHFYFDGEIELSGSEFVYYFSYEKNVIFYDHYFAVISAEEMQFIKGLDPR